MTEISVVMPVYNGERYLRESIDSIIAQSYKNWELILVDDCSTDSTPDIMRSYKDPRIKIIRNTTNCKLPQSLNIGFAEASGKYFTWTSDDNIYGENAFMLMADYLDNHEECGLIYTNMYYIDEKGTVDGESDNPPESLYFNDSVGASFMYRSDAAKATGLYDPEMFLVEDYDYWLRLNKKFEIHRIESTQYYYRRHENSLTEKKASKINEQLYKLRIRELDLILKKINNNEKKSLYIDMIYQNPSECSELKEKFFGSVLPEELSWTLRNRSIDKNRKLIIFGAGKYGEEALCYFGNKKVFCFADSNDELSGRKKCGKDIISFNEYRKISAEYQTVIAVNAKLLNGIANRLESCGIMDYVPYIMFRNNIMGRSNYNEF